MLGMQDDGRDQVSPTGLNPSLSLSRLTDEGITTVPVISCGPRANPSDQHPVVTYRIIIATLLPGVPKFSFVV